jgi:cysteine desulfurase/selenocysteine lyase
MALSAIAGNIRGVAPAQTQSSPAAWRAAFPALAQEINSKPLAYLDTEHLSDGALKYSAGTPNASGPVGLAAAIGFIRGIGHGAITAHGRNINRRMLDRLGAMRRVRLLGSRDADRRVSVFSLTVEGRAPADVLRAMDSEGIAIRAGDLASLPLLRHFGTGAAARASCYLYTSLDDVDRFADVLERVAAN